MWIDVAIRWLFRLRAPVLVGLGVLLALGAWNARLLSFDFSPQKLFVSDDPEYLRLERSHAVFGRDDATLLILVRGPGLLEESGLNYLRELHGRLEATAGVAGVDDLTSALVVRPGGFGLQPLVGSGEGSSGRSLLTAIRQQPLVVDRLVSADGRAALVNVSLDSDRVGFADLAPVVAAVRAVVDDASPPEGMDASLLGIPLARVFLVERLIGDQKVFLPLCIAAFFAVLWVLFRDLRSVLVPLLAVVVSLVLMAGLLGATHQSIDILNNVLPTLLFVIGVSDAIHVVARYRQELEAGRPKREALRVSIRHLGVACLFTSVTTAVGFISLAVGRLDILQRFGLLAGVGVMVAYGVTILLVPLLFDRLKPPLSGSAERVDAYQHRLALRFSDWTYDHRWYVIAGTIVLTVGCVWLAGRVEAESYLFESFPPDDPVVIANGLMEESFPGIVPFSILVEWQDPKDLLSPESLSYLAELQTFMAGRPGMSGAISFLDLLKEANSALHGGDPQWRRLPETSEESRLLLSLFESSDQGRTALGRLLSFDERLLRISASTGDVGSTGLAEHAGAIRRRLSEDAGRLESLRLSASLSGDGPVASGAVDRLISDMLRSFAVAFVFIFALMSLVLRSLKAALLTMIPNALPLLMTLAWMGAAGIDLQVPTVIVFSVALGLAVDDTIHFMVRFREELTGEAGTDLDQIYRGALRRTVSGTGQAILATSLLLAVGYSVLIASSFPVTRRFGMGMLVTVTAALIADLLALAGLPRGVETSTFSCIAARCPDRARMTGSVPVA